MRRRVAAAEGGSAEVMNVVVADDQRMFAEAFASLLAKQSDVVVDVARSLESSATFILDNPPHLVITDFRLSGIGVARALGLLRDVALVSPTVFLTGDTHPARLGEVARSGAHGIVIKSEPFSELQRIVRRVTAPNPKRETGTTKCAFSRRTRELVENARGKGRTDIQAVTPRELEVLAALIRGEDTATTAQMLGIGVATLRSHLQALYLKLGVHSRVGLIARAVRSGLVHFEAGSSEENELAS